MCPCWALLTSLLPVPRQPSPRPITTAWAQSIFFSRLRLPQSQFQSTVTSQCHLATLAAKKEASRQRGEPGWGGKKGGGRSPLLLLGKILYSGDEAACFWVSTETYKEQRKYEKTSSVMIYGILYLRANSTVSQMCLNPVQENLITEMSKNLIRRQSYLYDPLTQTPRTVCGDVPGCLSQGGEKELLATRLNKWILWPWEVAEVVKLNAVQQKLGYTRERSCPEKLHYFSLAGTDRRSSATLL